MNTFKINYEDGDFAITKMNCGLEDAKKYYAGSSKVTLLDGAIEMKSAVVSVVEVPAGVARFSNLSEPAKETAKEVAKHLIAGNNEQAKTVFRDFARVNNLVQWEALALADYITLLSTV